MRHLLHLHERVTVEILRDRAVERHNTYVEATGPGMAVLAVPLAKTGPVRVAPGTKVKVGFVRHGVQHWFESEVAGPGGGSEGSFTVVVPAAVGEAQRREFVRAEICVPAEFEVTSAPSGGETGRRRQGVIRSISGGGLLLGTEHELAPGTILELVVRLPDGEPVKAVGEVMRVVVDRNAGPGRQWFGVGFVSIKERERDRLIGYIFAEQGKARARGLL